MSAYQISTSQEYYGDVTESEATEMASKIAEIVTTEYPDVDVKIIDGTATRHDYDDKEAEIQQFVNDNWSDWV